MKTEFYIKTQREGRAWAWFFLRESETLAGGYCRTKAEANSDAEIYAAEWFSKNPAS